MALGSLIELVANQESPRDPAKVLGVVFETFTNWHGQIKITTYNRWNRFPNLGLLGLYLISNSLLSTAAPQLIFVKPWFVKTKQKLATLDDSGPLCAHPSKRSESLQDGHDASGRGQQRAPSKQNRIMADQ